MTTDTVPAITASYVSVNLPYRHPRLVFDNRWIAALLLFIAGLVIRVLNHSHNALFLDEATSVLIASHSGAGIIRALSHDGNAPLYYLLLHGWMSVFGDGEDAVRGLSVLLGALLAPGLYLMGRRFVGGTAAATAGGLAILWPVHVDYSNYARMYSVLPVLSLLYLYLLLDALEAGMAAPRAKWVVVGVSAVALVWTHNYGMFVVAASPTVWWLWQPRVPGTGRRLAATLILVGLVDLLWLPVVWEQTRSGVGDFLASVFTPMALLHSLWLFSAGFRVQYDHRMGINTTGTTLFAIAWWLAATVGPTVLALRDPVLRAKTLTWLAMVLIPIGIPWVISLVIHPIFLPGRYDIVAYPAFALLLGTGAEATHRRLGSVPRVGVVLATVMFTTYAALATITLVDDQRGPPIRVSEAMASMIAEHAAPGDVVITTALTRAPIEYYARHLTNGRSLQLHSIPASTDLHVGWYDFRAMSTDSAAVDSEVVTLVDDARKSGHSVFVVAEAGAGEMGRDIQILREVLDARATREDLLMDYFANDDDRFATDQIVLYHLSRQ